jgi:ATP-dependent Lhr-like helicase
MKSQRLFHPSVDRWFSRTFGAPTGAQAEAWPAIIKGTATLIAAPTGSGKTLAAFLAAIDSLVRQGLDGSLRDQTQVVYVSPLKALSNDIERNLALPLAGIRAELEAQGLPDVHVRTCVRTGDTPAGERLNMRRRPPHIVVTTPESLYVLLGSESGRAMLQTTRTVIVDEIHALAGNKRGAHLALSLERLSALCSHPVQRVGLSATQKPIESVADLLVGTGSFGSRKCRIVDHGHRRPRDLALVVPASPLEAVMSAEVWGEVYDRLACLVAEHRTTLIFANTRRMVERVTRHLAERLGSAHVAAHHGSLSKEHRLDAEKRLQRGELKVLVATASLELGIDIGEVDLVCQLGSPRSIATFLQRVGRSGHAVDGTPKGRLFPLSRDDLVECAALLDSTRRGELDRLIIPEKPLDVLAQHIVAEVGAREWPEQNLYELFRQAWPYRHLTRDRFDAVVAMLSDGFTTRRGRRGALIHHDAVNGVLRGRRGARLTALMSGGTIPDNADFQVLLEPQNLVVGSVNEDFAVESLAGDVFQLGNTSYRIIRVERGVVRVEDAQGAPPTIPFWLGEAPGRSDELSASVSRLRAELSSRLGNDALGGTARLWLATALGITEDASSQLVEYLDAARLALGCLPTQKTIVLERFFDEAGGMQLVIHSPYGSRINRAWGLALRKRFCRKFNFELQAAATEDCIVLSLTTAHSFELGEVARYLQSASVAEVLTQALLDAPMFITRWRWVAGVSLALPRFRGGKKVPPQLARMAAEDLVASVFPDQLACAENLAGEREVPNHPLVDQAISDCLHEAMDLGGLQSLLEGIETGAVKIVARDLTAPSPLALEVLTARPYAYLDDAPLEERRTQAVMSRRWLDPETAADLGRLDAAAIERVRLEAWPEPASADELHDALLWLGFITSDEADQYRWTEWLSDLARLRRVGRLELAEKAIWIAAERLRQLASIWPKARIAPVLVPPPAMASQQWSREKALVEIVRGRLEGSGPIAVGQLNEVMELPIADITAALASLEVEGFAMRGRFTPDALEEEWCERRLLARINRYTVKRLRAEIEPVAAREFMRFLLSWQHVDEDSRMQGPEALAPVIGQLEGFEAPAGAWEREILAARIKDYQPSWLDDRCRSGRLSWMRLRSPSRKGVARRTGPVKSTPITLLPRKHAAIWRTTGRSEEIPLRPHTQMVADHICQHGASFFGDIVSGTGLLRTQVEDALAELVAFGLANSDCFGGLRALLVPSAERKPFFGARRRHRTASYGMDEAGRWAIVPAPAQQPDTVEHMARSLLCRYGVVFWRLIEREADRLPPWRDLLRAYRLLESRGEIRGGRFVAGFTGEQFALPEAVKTLRDMRRRTPLGQLISVSGADPLNLVGILTPGARLPALAGNRILYQDGLPVAVLAGGEMKILHQPPDIAEWELRLALLGRSQRHLTPQRTAAASYADLEAQSAK